MFKRSILSAFILAAGLISTQANAAFIATDLKDKGDALATLDTETGIEWLDLTLTKGMSINAVLNSIANGSLKGWRLPTASEVENLMRASLPTFTFTYMYNSGVPYYADTGSGAKTRIVDSWRNMFGKTSQHQSYGFYLKGSAVCNAGALSDGVSYFTVLSACTPGDLSSSPYLNQGSSAHGMWLVSDGGLTLSSINDPMLNINNPNAPANQVPEVPADVPVHAGFGLLGLLLMAFGLRRRNSA